MVGPCNGTADNRLRSCSGPCPYHVRVSSDALANLARQATCIWQRSQRRPPGATSAPRRTVRMRHLILEPSHLRNVGPCSPSRPIDVPTLAVFSLKLNKHISTANMRDHGGINHAKRLNGCWRAQAFSRAVSLAQEACRPRLGPRRSLKNANSYELAI